MDILRRRRRERRAAAPARAARARRRDGRILPVFRGQVSTIGARVPYPFRGSDSEIGPGIGEFSYAVGNTDVDTIQFGVNAVARTAAINNLDATSRVSVIFQDGAGNVISTGYLPTIMRVPGHLRARLLTSFADALGNASTFDINDVTVVRVRFSQRERRGGGRQTGFSTPALVCHPQDLQMCFSKAIATQLSRIRWHTERVKLKNSCSELAVLNNLKGYALIKKLLSQHKNGKNICKLVGATHLTVDELLESSRIVREDYWFHNWKGLNSKPNSVMSKALRERAIEICDGVGWDPEVPVPFGEIYRFEEYLTETLGVQCRIKVFDKLKECIFDSRTPADRVAFPNIAHYFYLKLEEEHYTPIMGIHTVVSQHFYCPNCSMGYNSKQQHVCGVFCKGCGSEQVNHNQTSLAENKIDVEVERIRCGECNRDFVSTACVLQHLKVQDKQKHSMCLRKWKCLKEECKNNRCYTQVGVRAVSPAEHVCTDRFCQPCKAWVPPWPLHKCFVLNKTPRDSKRTMVYVDFESTQEGIKEGINGELLCGVHEVNLAVSFVMNQNGGHTEFVHYNIKEWVTHFLKDKEYEGCTFVFHNGKGYDFQFIVGQVTEEANLKPYLVRVGTKILHMVIGTTATKPRGIGGYTFVDSLNFLTMSLSRFSKTFGLSSKKGFYPHLFNTFENTNYIGPMPPLETFGVNSMSKSHYEEVKAWHTEKVAASYVWDNKFELLSYCRADVKLLMEGCECFNGIVANITKDIPDMLQPKKKKKKKKNNQEAVEEVQETKRKCTHIVPFQFPTLASSAMAIFRAKFMPKDVIAALPIWLARELKASFAGGRCGCCKLYWKNTTPGDRAWYVDFTSLYPYINKFGTYPKGHPVVSKQPVTNQTTIQQLLLEREGVSVMCVDVLCPPGLYHPFLHEKRDGKLMFDLCAKSRVWYTSLELREALCLGYVITIIHTDVYWCSVEIGIFARYVNAFLQLKQQAAGWPEGVESAEQKQGYIDEYFIKSKGIKLEASKIGKKNPGLYSTAKLYLNSLWGKFGQRLSENYDKHEILTTSTGGSARWYELIANNQLTDFVPLSKTSALVTYSAEEKVSAGTNSSNGISNNDNELVDDKNIALAVFTTAQARIKLYKEFLEPCGKRVLYYDTDSLIFVTKEGEDPSSFVKLGDQLGEATNELGKDYGGSDYKYGDSYISEFFSGGPKNYGYTISKRGSDETSTNLKVKGVCLNRRDVSKDLNYSAARDVITSQSSLKLNFDGIRRSTTEAFTITTNELTKIYRRSFTKRKLLAAQPGETTIDSIPWTDDDTEEYEALKKSLMQKKDNDGDVVMLEEKEQGPDESSKRQKTNYIYAVEKEKRVSSGVIYMVMDTRAGTYGFGLTGNANQGDIKTYDDLVAVVPKLGPDEHKVLIATLGGFKRTYLSRRYFWLMNELDFEQIGFVPYHKGNGADKASIRLMWFAISGSHKLLVFKAETSQFLVFK